MNPAAKRFSPTLNKKRSPPLETKSNDFTPDLASRNQIRSSLAASASEFIPGSSQANAGEGSTKQGLPNTAGDRVLNPAWQHPETNWKGDGQVDNVSSAMNPTAKTFSPAIVVTKAQNLSEAAAVFVPKNQIHDNLLSPIQNLSVAATEFVPTSIAENASCSAQWQPMVSPVQHQEDKQSLLMEHRPYHDQQTAASVRPNNLLDPSANCYSPAADPISSQQTVRSHTPAVREKPLCRFFQQGACRKGLQCVFSHDLQRVTNSIRELVSPPECEDKSVMLETNGKGDDYYVVDEGIKCHFGPGAAVLQMQLGPNEAANVHGSKRILVSGLTAEIKDFDLEARLAIFGGITTLVRKNDHYAYCTFEQSESSVQAISSLNGTPAASWVGVAGEGDVKAARGNKKGKQRARKSGFVSVTLVAESGLVAMSSSSRNATVKLHWYSPSRIAWLHFHYRFQAEKAAKACHGKPYFGRVVSCRFQRPTFNQTCSFSVWVGGLGENVSKCQLAQFVAKHARGIKPESIRLEDAPFRDKDGAGVVRTLLLSSGGTLVHFEEDKDNYRFPHNLKRRALAKFADVKDAAQACAYFKSTDRVPGLGGTKVHCQRVYSAKFTLQTHLFLLVQRACTDAIQGRRQGNLSQAPEIRFKIFHNGNNSSLLLQADDAAKLASLKNQISDLVAGELILDPCCKREQKVPFWKDFFASRDTASRVMEKVLLRFGQQNVVVLFHKRCREVRLFAKESLLEKARDFVVGELTTLKPIASAVPISNNRYKFLLAGGRELLDTLIAACLTTVSVDLKHQALLVEGSPQDAKRAVACLTRLMSKTSVVNKAEDEKPCPICFCNPDEDGASNAVELSCSHRYCRDCFQAWLCGGHQTCSFPVQCLAEGCSQALTMKELGKLLPRPDFLSLLRSAVDNHVLSNLAEYQFCLSPGCNGIYTNDPSSRTAACSTCQMIICRSCKAQDHEGLTCEQYKIAKLPPRLLRNHIIEEILTLRCPRCSCAFLDFDGCFALTCSNCKCGFCGWCLKDCGHDAHSHVKSCTSKPLEARNETYFGSKDQFHEAQRKRRRHELIQFLRTLHNLDDQQAALMSIQQDLKDLGLNDVTIHSLKG